MSGSLYACQRLRTITEDRRPAARRLAHGGDRKSDSKRIRAASHSRESGDIERARLPHTAGAQRTKHRHECARGKRRIGAASNTRGDDIEPRPHTAENAARR